jgi:anti-sigma-K factor RskA
MAEIDHTRQDRPRPSRGGSAGSPPWVTRLALPAAAALALLAVGVGIISRPVPDDTSDRLMEILTAPDAAFAQAVGPGDSRARLVMSPDKQEAVFVVLGMEPAPHAHVYELWLVHEDGHASAGVFDVDEQGRAMHMLSADMDPVIAVGVTIEPEGGSPEPTTEPLMLISLRG